MATGGGEDRVRCAWAAKAIFHDYHDREWGKPVHDDRVHFEFLILEGMQAGLSWETILRRRAGFRRAFSDFDAAAVAGYGAERQAELLTDTGIIRNRAKIAAAVSNAACFIDIQREYGSFDEYIWGFTGGEIVSNDWSSAGEIPARTELSDRLAADMKRLGFKFAGSVIMYAHLQAVGIVNDHEARCAWKFSS